MVGEKLLPGDSLSLHRRRRAVPCGGLKLWDCLPHSLSAQRSPSRLLMNDKWKINDSVFKIAHLFTEDGTDN